MLTPVDYVVVAIYGVLVAGLGYAAKRLVHNTEDYFTGGRKVPWWMAAISHHVSGYSAFAFVGYASVAYTTGFAIWTLFAWPCFVALMIGAYLWAPRWSRLRVQTPIEYLERRFNNTVRQVFAWSGIGVKFIDEGAKLYSLSMVVHVVTGWPLQQVIVGTGIVTILYLFMGGFWATVLTDFAQFFVQFSITLVLVPLALKAVGGWSTMWNSLPEGMGSLFNGSITPWFVFVYGIVIILSYNGGTWGLAQRFYSIGRAKDARKAAILSGFLYLLYPIAIYTPVWAARLIVGEIPNPEQSYVLVAERLLKGLAPGLLGLFVISMFAATMSMIDSDLNALSAVFTKDIFERNFMKSRNDRLLLKIGVIATIVLGALTIESALLTIKLQGAFKAMIEWFAAILGPVSIPLLFGMLYRKTTWKGALGAWAAGFVTFVFVKYAVPGWFGLSTGFPEYTGAELLVTFAVFYIEGMVSRRTPEEEERVQALFRQLEGEGEQL